MTTSVKPQEIFKGPVLTRKGITYHQDTNEPFTGVVETFNNDSQLWERQNYKDGKREGLWEMFYENGQLSFRGNYKNGKQDGLLEYFDEDGNLTSTETYRNGELVEEN